MFSPCIYVCIAAALTSYLVRSGFAFWFYFIHRVWMDGWIGLAGELVAWLCGSCYVCMGFGFGGHGWMDYGCAWLFSGKDGWAGIDDGYIYMDRSREGGERREE